MSRLWPDRLLLSLAPGAVALARVSRGPRPRLLDQQRIECDPACGAEPWQGAIAALEAAVAPLRRERLRVTAVLSNHFVRYAVVPYDAAAATPEEESALARFQFRKIHGERSDRWEIRVGTAPRGAPRLASAVDGALIEALRGQFPRQGTVRLVSAQPWLMSVFNLWSRRAAHDAWLLLVEPGRACCARFEARGGFRAVQSVRGEFRSAEDWAALMEREALRAGVGAAADAVVMRADGGDAPVNARALAWTFNGLMPPVLTGYQPLEHAGLAMALSAR